MNAIRKRGQEIAEHIEQVADAILPTLKALAVNKSIDPNRRTEVVSTLFEGLKRSAGEAIAKRLAEPIVDDDDDIAKLGAPESRRSVRQRTEGIAHGGDEDGDEIEKGGASLPSESVVAIAKNLAEGEITGTTLQRRDFTNALLRGASCINGKGETIEQAFARYADTPDGRVLMKARALATGGDYQAPEPQRADPPMTPSLLALWGIADKIREAEPKLTKEQSFARALDTKEGARHYKSYKGELAQGVGR